MTGSKRANASIREAVRQALRGKAVALAIPFIAAWNSAVPVAVAQEASEGDSRSRQSGGLSDETIAEIVVHGKVILLHDQAFSATKMDMELKDIPQSVSVITTDLIEMSHIEKIQDVYRIDASSGVTHRLDDFPTSVFRGFSVEGSNALRIDGFRFPGNVQLDLSTFERLELVKGPTSAMFGANSIGGAINGVTKQPSTTRVAEIGLEGGSHSSYRADIDYGNVLSADGHWQYRLIGVYRDSDTYIDKASDNAWIVSPSVAFEPNSDTRIVAAFNYQRHHDSTHWGTGLQEFAPGQYRVLPGPRNQNFGQPWNDREIEVTYGNIKLQHFLTDNWTLRANVQGSKVSKEALQCSADGNSTAEGVIPAGCYTYVSVDEDELFGGEVNLIGDIDLFGHVHQLFLGVDYSRVKEKSRFGYDYIDDNGDGLADGSAEGVGYRVSPATALHQRIDPSELYYVLDTVNDTVFGGVTVQTLINPTDKLKVLLAGRFTFDDVLERSRRGGQLPELNDQPYERARQREVSIEEFIPQAGITYAFTDNLSVYLNWGETYSPDTQFFLMFDPDNPAGKPLPPEEGENIEIGMKAKILDGRVTMTAALFDMDRTGISSADREHPPFRIPIGAQTSKGVELAFAGNVSEAFDIYWSGAYLDAEYTGGEGGLGAAPAGERPTNTPKYASSLFLNYAVLDGPLRGLGIGAGWVYKELYPAWGRVTNGDANGGIVAHLGDINEVDLRVHYETDAWSYYVSAEDITDSRYYSPVRVEYRWGVSVNPGRRILAGVKYRF